MISIYNLAQIANSRLKQDVNKQNNAPNWSKIYSTRNQPFSERLVHSCKVQKDDPKGIENAIFIAHPERLLSRIAYLSVGDLRQSKILKKFDKDKHDISNSQVELLQNYLKLNDYCEFSNLSTRSDVEKISKVLIAHGLGPISDTVALLADIGRATRTAMCFNLKVEVLLADISWMSSNRSIRRFEGLTKNDIDSGLRICLDRRNRLYEALKFTPKKKEITSFARKDKIYYGKLLEISNHYKELSKELWGENSIGSLDYSIIKVISKPLYNLNISDPDIPSHMKIFSQFPGVLKKIEEGLEDHLKILRSIAKHFNSFDEEIFTYFFAQYYAQDEFRGNSLKVAVHSETKFDKPFDELDKYFKAWGEGHTISELLHSGVKSISSEQKLSAIYLPQYKIGDFEVLPYSSLSLDISKHPSKDHALVYKELICLDYKQDDELLLEIINKTATIDKNRMLADLTSYILYAHYVFGENFINTISNKVTNRNIEKNFEFIDNKGSTLYNHELESYSANQLTIVWETWLDSIETENEENYTHIPLHFLALLLDSDDWQSEKIVNGYLDVIKISIMIYNEITN